MAFKKGGHTRPQYSISTSVAIRKGKYLKGPSFGLWINDKSDFPMARGSVKENYLEELIEFLQKAAKRDLSVSFALFENKKQKSRDSDDDDEEEWGSKKGKSKKEDPEEEEEEKPSKKSSSKKDSGKKSGGSDWDFDNDDDD